MTGELTGTQELLDEAGLVYAGTGRTLEEARAARFQQTPKGRIGLVGMDSGAGTAAATYRLGNVGGRPGLNPLRVNQHIIVTTEQLAALRQIRDAVYANVAGAGVPHLAPLPGREPTDRLQLFGTSYRAGSDPGRVSYTMNQSDLHDNLRSIRNGKQYSDFMIATIHAHQSAWAFGSTIFSGNAGEPPDFLIDLARQAIDQGADIFLGHGPHVLRGVEVYKGKPIFYGLGEFTRQIQMSLADDRRYQEAGLNPFATERTEAELIYGWRSGRRMMAPENFEGLIAESRFDGGRLVEVRLHPTIAGYDAPLSRMGIPRVPPADVARRMLEKLQALSEPFGTTIDIEKNVGVIRVEPSASPTAAR